MYEPQHKWPNKKMNCSYRRFELPSDCLRVRLRRSCLSLDQGTCGRQPFVVEQLSQMMPCPETGSGRPDRACRFPTSIPAGSERPGRTWNGGGCKVIVRPRHGWMGRPFLPFQASEQGKDGKHDVHGKPGMFQQ